MPCAIASRKSKSIVAVAGFSLFFIVFILTKRRNEKKNYIKFAFRHPLERIRMQACAKNDKRGKQVLCVCMKTKKRNYRKSRRRRRWSMCIVDGDGDVGRGTWYRMQWQMRVTVRNA